MLGDFLNGQEIDALRVYIKSKGLNVKADIEELVRNGISSISLLPVFQTSLNTTPQIDKVSTLMIHWVMCST